MNFPPACFPLSFFLFLGVLALPGLCAADAQPPMHLEITGSHTLRITYDCTFVWPSTRDAHAVFYLPIPPDTGAQHIENFNSSLKGAIETDDASPPHRLLTANLRHEPDDERRVRYEIAMTGHFQTRQLVAGPPNAHTVIVPPGPGEFLASTESINWDSDVFQSWLDSSGLRRAGNETPLHFGERVYAFFKAHGRYSYPPETAWNAAAACRHLHTDCGGFSLVYTAACRANNIPARLLVGQCFKARQSGDGSVELTGERQAHVIAEFFDPQIGWIPEDISATFLHVPGYADLNFFGRDPGYFFAWHVDTDYHFNTPRKPDAHVQWMQNPSPWFSEEADEANDTVSHHWEVETVN